MIMFFLCKNKVWAAITLMVFITGSAPVKLLAATPIAVSLVEPCPQLRGIRLNPDAPFRMEFIFDGKALLSRHAVNRAVEYFLAAMTMPEKDLWVNLSPAEQGRIINDNLAKTRMGQSLLKEDYILKQLAASLTNPDTEEGKKYWDEINNVGARSPRPLSGRGNPAPTQTFNKVWIVPEGAIVRENGQGAYIEKSGLKVLCEEGVIASSVSIQAFKTHILPLINHEVNQGKAFGELRQIYNAFVLATWFKRKVKDSIFKYYIDEKKVTGIDRADPHAKEKVYNAYMDAFKKGAYNYIKKERMTPYGGNSTTGSSAALHALTHPGLIKITRRHYFSGGVRIDSNNIQIIRDPRIEAQLNYFVTSGQIWLVYFSDAAIHDYLDRQQALQAFYGAGEDDVEVDSNYQAEAGWLEEHAPGGHKSVILGLRQERLSEPGIYRFKRPGHEWYVDVALEMEDNVCTLNHHSLFFACYRQGFASIVLSRSNPLSGEIKPGDTISEVAEAAETIYWQSRLAHDRWEDNFFERYDPADISLPELLKVKALTEIIKAYGEKGLTPLQKKYLSSLTPIRAGEVRQALEDGFLNRRDILRKYLGPKDSEILFTYIQKQYLPALNALVPVARGNGGAEIDGRNLKIVTDSDMIFHLSPDMLKQLQNSSGMTFLAEPAPAQK